MRVLADGLVVVDTCDDDNRKSRSIAVDSTTGKPCWEDEGGPNFALSAAGGQLASSIAVDQERIAMTLRDLRTGRRSWTASSVNADYVAPLLAADSVIGTIAGERVDVYDRQDGRQVQSLPYESTLVGGGCLAATGLIDVVAGHVVCLSG